MFLNWCGSCWLLVIGYCLLVIGYQLLVIKFSIFRSGRSIWTVKFWLNNKSYPPNATPLHQIVPTPHSPFPIPLISLPLTFINYVLW